MKRILSGMRPTGKLHLGHFVGALENWVQLQNSHEFDPFFLVADYHSLTNNLDSSNTYQNTIEMVIDWLAAGIQPEKSPIFRQSQIKEHTELFLIFSLLISTSRLERNPSLKDQIRDLSLDTISYAHLGYPVLQSADILLYKGSLVPVGEDQLPHIEITREIARRFNQTYPKSEGEVVFEEPEGLVTKFARLVGLDGKSKMSKSLGNTILLSDAPDEVTKKMRLAFTDPLKIRKNDKGNPDGCVVYAYHQRFTEQESTAQIYDDCKNGAIGCVDCKKLCSTSVSNFLSPILEKRKRFEATPEDMKSILHDGEVRAKNVAQQTMEEVREVMKLG